MPDTFAITIIFIVVSTCIAAFIKGRTRDKCLKDFKDNLVTLEDITGKIVWGRLNVETTGMEFIYPEKHFDQDGHYETSFVLYKFEYDKVHALLRYHDDMDKKAQAERKKELEQTYHPGLLLRLKRKLINVFKTVRDSLMEVVNLLIATAKNASPAGTVLASQDKYVTKIKQDVIGSVGTSYEPLLEKYIGKKVVLELQTGDRIHEYCGILKDYTADFLEVLDVEYKLKEDDAPKKADVVVPRKFGIIRHLGE